MLVICDEWRVNGVLAVTESRDLNEEFVVGSPYTTETELWWRWVPDLACDGYVIYPQVSKLKAQILMLLFYLWDVITDQALLSCRDIEDAQEASHALLKHALAIIPRIMLLPWLLDSNITPHERIASCIYIFCMYSRYYWILIVCMIIKKLYNAQTTW